MKGKEVLVIGSGIAGMTCALRCAEKGLHVMLVSPYPSERAQSVMTAGGINEVLAEGEAGDSVAAHVQDTILGGSLLAGEEAVSGLCAGAESASSAQPSPTTAIWPPPATGRSGERFARFTPGTLPGIAQKRSPAWRCAP